MTTEIRQGLIARALTAKQKIKEAGHTHILPIYAFLYPKDNSKERLSRVQNVVQGRIPDKAITERFEDMADQVRDKGQ